MTSLPRIVHYNTTDLDRIQLDEFGAQLKNVFVEFKEDELDEKTVDPEAVIISVFVNSRVTKEILDKMPTLRLIICRSTGFNNVDLEAASKRNIAVCNIPRYGVQTVAEYALGLLLSLTKKINRPVQLGMGVGSPEMQGVDIFGKTIGVIGTGAIGRHFIKLVNSFGVKVLAYDVAPNMTAARELGFEYVSLEDLLSRSDIISLHAPATADTRHLINLTTLKIMKSNAFLINTSRGELVDSMAIIEAITSGHLAGVALDVFEGEKLIWDNLTDHPNYAKIQSVYKTLVNMPQVIITPHNAFNTIEAVERINKQTVQSINEFFAGRVDNQVNAITD